MSKSLKSSIARFVARMLQGCTTRPECYRHRYRPLLEFLESRLVPATYTWVGNGATENWSDGNNWQHINGFGQQVVGAPSAGDDVLFNGTGMNGNQNSVLDTAAVDTLNRF